MVKRIITRSRLETTIFCDNQNAIAQVDNMKDQNMKHFIRNLIVNYSVKLIYLPSYEMIANIMKKPLTRERHWCHNQNLGLLVGMKKREVGRKWECSNFFSPYYFMSLL